MSSNAHPLIPDLWGIRYDCPCTPPPPHSGLQACMRKRVFFTMQNLKLFYQKELVPILIQKFNYNFCKNIPKITKIILNSELDLSYYQFFLNKPIVISYFGNDQILLDHNNQQIFKYKATALNKLAFFHNSNDACILSMNGRKLIRVTEQYQIDSLSLATFAKM